MWAAENGYTDTVNKLLKNGAKVDLKDKKGYYIILF